MRTRVLVQSTRVIEESVRALCLILPFCWTGIEAQAFGSVPSDLRSSRETTTASCTVRNGRRRRVIHAAGTGAGAAGAEGRGSARGAVLVHDDAIIAEGWNQPIR